MRRLGSAHRPALRPAPTATATAAADGSATADDTADDGAAEELTPANLARRLTVAMMAAGSVSQAMSTTVEGVTVEVVADTTVTKTSQDVRATTDMGALGTVDVLVVDGIVYFVMGEMTDGK